MDIFGRCYCCHGRGCSQCRGNVSLGFQLPRPEIIEIWLFDQPRTRTSMDMERQMPRLRPWIVKWLVDELGDFLPRGALSSLTTVIWQSGLSLVRNNGVTQAMREEAVAFLENEEEDMWTCRIRGLATEQSRWFADIRSGQDDGKVALFNFMFQEARERDPQWRGGNSSTNTTTATSNSNTSTNNETTTNIVNHYTIISPPPQNPNPQIQQQALPSPPPQLQLPSPPPQVPYQVPAPTPPAQQQQALTIQQRIDQFRLQNQTQNQATATPTFTAPPAQPIPAPYTPPAPVYSPPPQQHVTIQAQNNQQTAMFQQSQSTQHYASSGSGSPMPAMAGQVGSYFPQPVQGQLPQMGQVPQLQYGMPQIGTPLAGTPLAGTPPVKQKKSKSSKKSKA